MQLRLTRINFQNSHTIGQLEVLKDNQWAYLCDTLEEPVRTIKRYQKYKYIDSRGLFIHTAIPVGLYVVTMNVQSPKYSNYKQYPFARQYRGYIPRLVNVKKFESVLIKPGMRTTKLNGSILVGFNKNNDRMCDSSLVWSSLMEHYFYPAKLSKEQITIEIR